jgi:Lipocalin-like domain
MISRPEILGAWRLVSYEVRAMDGTIIDYPFGEDADGFLVYTDDGYMSAQLMRRHRSPYDHPWGVGGLTEQSAAAARGYLAYSGPFDVDEDNGTVRHHASISLYPNWVGGDQVRHAELRDGRLILVAGVDDQFGPGARASITWQRPG